jgi:two-component system sensor histidine kinase RpfC
MYVSTLVGRLTKALANAEVANQAKRRFISSVSHELCTPLNTIIGMADLLHSTALRRDQADMVSTLGNASQLMLSLIEDVLDFSKVEAGKLVLECVDFDLHQLVNNMADIFKYQAEARNVKLLIHTHPRVPYALRGDPHHLRQVLVNLL